MQTARREFLVTSFAGAMGLALSPWGALAQAAGEKKSAKACILLYLQGGPSHIDTFDPKPGTPTGGSYTAIDTKIAAVKFSQHLPKLAAVSDKLAIIRSMTSKEGDHDRGTVLLHTGYSPTPALVYPALGSIIAKEKQDESVVAPGFVSVGDTDGSGYLGPEFGPYVVGDPLNPGQNLALPDGFALERLNKRMKALEAFNQGFAKKSASSRPLDFTRLSIKANRMRESAALKSFDPATEEGQLWQAYGGEVGDGSLARSLIFARRMVENGVRFVEVTLGNWDTHTDNFNLVAALSAQLDSGLATLVKDLSDRGQLESTLVVCVGEFGRTPQINGDNGRDHHSDVFSAVVAGGGIQGGRVIGSSDDAGAQVKDRPVTFPDLHATLLHACGIDPAREYNTPDGRPIKLTSGGKVVQELF
ncbi:MAG: DUF1501 domain-containing protein [Pirellulaceae bacterium]|nr:DUF1501 domain-containing protein [Pirellulaceae bacterium]